MQAGYFINISHYIKKHCIKFIIEETTEAKSKQSYSRISVDLPAKFLSSHFLSTDMDI